MDVAISMVSNLIAESGAQRCLQRRALQLLRVDDTVQVPVLVQMLQVDNTFIFEPTKSKPDSSPSTPSAVVYFPCFWQAMHELQKRLGGSEHQNADAEPIAVEISSFRDAALDLAAAQRLTTASFADLLISFKETSTDPVVWDGLLNSVHFLMHEKDDLKQGHSRTLQQLVLAQKPMSMAFLAAIVLPWLFELCEDYLRGWQRGARCVHESRTT